MKKFQLSIVALCVPMILIGLASFKPFTSSRPWNDTPQKIPGIIENEFYDLGGEGVAYHDTDSVNNGSGKLNPANGIYLNEFRMKEGVDISYTKTKQVDDHPYNKVKPKMDQLYVGWTTPGEWIQYTVDVEVPGKYTLGIQYRSHDEGGISFLLDGKKVTGTIRIPTTYDSRDTVAWRQWHHWNFLGNAAELSLPKGRHVLTLKTEANGNMNYDFMTFTRK